MPAPARGRVPQILVHVSMPKVLIERIEEVLKRDGTWGTSVADFVRQAASEKIRELDGRDAKLTEGELRAAREARVR